MFFSCEIEIFVSLSKILKVNIMKNKINLLSLAIILAFLVSCKSTSLVNVWSNPDMPEKQYTNIAIIALFNDEGEKHVIESELVAQFKRNGVEAVSSSQVMSLSKSTTKEEIEAMLKAQGCDAVLTLRPLGVDKSYNVESGVDIGIGNPYFYGYYSGYWNSPVYVSTNKTYNVENNLYDVSSTKLSWTAKSETFDPTSVDAMTKSIGTEILLSLQKKGFVTLQKK